jgi:hypothetical protein
MLFRRWSVLKSPGPAVIESARQLCVVPSFQSVGQKNMESMVFDGNATTTGCITRDPVSPSS